MSKRLNIVALPCRLMLALVLFALPFAGRAVTADSLIVSLLTCEPGTESYELYGHTALRVRTADGRYDAVYNYGAFTMDEPHFIWRFLMGQTDYMLLREPTFYLRPEYLSRGRSIREQVLDLTPAEAERLIRRVENEAQTPGWTYRYNFFRDNCTTRALLAISEALDGTLQLDQQVAAQHRRTLRDVVAEHTAQPMPWSDFGENLLLGADVDTLLDAQGLQAFPEDAYALLQKASIKRADGSRRPLVKADNLIKATTDGPQVSPTPLLLQPLSISLLLLLLSVWLSFRQWRGRAAGTRLFDGALMLLTGCAGCLVWLLFWFSELPAVGSNWLIGLLSPLPLLWLPRKILVERRGQTDRYIACVQPWIVSLAFFAVSPMQEIQWPVYVLALSLLLRSIAERRQRFGLTSWHDKASIALWTACAFAAIVYKAI